MAFTVTTGPTTPTGGGEKAQAARDRAITMLMGSAPGQAAPVSNPSNITVEEIAAVKPPEPETRQLDTIEGTSSPETATTAPAEATPTPKEDPLSSQYAQLARKEKAMRAKALELKTREDAYKAREAEMERKYQDQLASAERSWKERLSKDPLSVMNETGLSYEQLTNLALNAPKPEDVARDQAFSKLESELKAVRELQEKAAKNYEDQQTAAYQQALENMRTETRQLVSSNEAFETIKATNSVNDVVELIEQTFKKDGTLLSVEEAAQAVEDYLVEEGLKIAKLKKIQQRMQPAPSNASAPKQQPQETAKQPQQLKTLTNAVGSSPRMSSRERAILAFKGELRK